MKISAAKFRALAAGKAHKYHAEPVVIDGVRFDSKAEARRYRELLLLQGEGMISGLKRQPKFIILDVFTDRRGKKHRARCYIGDFEYFERGERVVEDVKGVETPVFSLKRDMFLARYPEIDLRIVKR